MTIAPQFYRTCNLTAEAKTAIFCGLQHATMNVENCRVKRLPTTVISQNPRFSAKPIVMIAAEKREALLVDTAVYPRGDLWT